MRHGSIGAPLALALLGAVIAIAPARGAEVPATLRAVLPDARAARAAIEADPRVIGAVAEREAARARASGLRRGPHEWTAGGQWSNRRIAGERRYDEWELSLERALRSPGKAGADARTAEAEERAGETAVAKARQDAAADLLAAWLEWLAAEEALAHAETLVGIAAADADAIAARVGSGDAPLVARDATLAALAAARREARLARLRAETARATLGARFPRLALPDPAPRLPEPSAVDGRPWLDRLVESNASLAVARDRAAVAARRAERAALDRRADPTVGLRTFSERGGDETGLGVYVSVPLGAGPRQALASEAHALAAVAEAEADAMHIEARRAAEQLVGASEGLGEAWRLAAEALAAQREETRRLARGRELGGIDAATLLAARRREREAAVAEIEARAAAWQATARLLLEARALWAPD
jgi:outer membrane protein TolC